MQDFIILPGRARLSIVFEGELGSEGFMTIKRLWIIFLIKIIFIWAVVKQKVLINKDTYHYLKTQLVNYKIISLFTPI